jgi:hypothetical protein
VTGGTCGTHDKLGCVSAVCFAVAVVCLHLPVFVHCKARCFVHRKARCPARCVGVCFRLRAALCGVPSACWRASGTESCVCASICLSRLRPDQANPDGTEMMLVMEYMPKGDLYNALAQDTTGSLKWNRRCEPIFAEERALRVCAFLPFWFCLLLSRGLSSVCLSSVCHLSCLAGLSLPGLSTLCSLLVSPSFASADPTCPVGCNPSV